MRIYVAGALSSKEKKDRNPSKVVVEYIQNVHRLCNIGGDLMMEGYAPFIPGLDLLTGLVNGYLEEGDYRGTSMEFLEVCDAVLVTSMSWGVKKEIERAKELNIPVYFNIKDLPKPNIGDRC